VRKLARLGVTLVCLWMFEQAAMAAMHQGEVPADTKTVTYIVREGDTLWSIASRCDTKDDTRAVVDFIERINGLHGAVLVVGQAIRIPAGR
jgi:nucleoid-associated protein YgaU